MWDGVILAPNRELGEKFRSFALLRNWYIATPKTLLDGRSRSVKCEPRIIAVDDPRHDPISHTVLQYSNYLVDLCGGRMPAVWHVHKAGG